MNARYRIEHWFERLGQPGETMKREDVCFVMVQARHLIEASAAPERYRVVDFYADWTVHTALDRSAVCFEALRDITRVIAENMAPTSPDLTTQISRIIGFPQLRAELMALFRENNLPVTVFEFWENWNGFAMFLLWHLAGQPIGFPADPKGAARRIRDEMLAIPRPHDIAVEALAIVNHEGRPHWCLHVSGEKTFTMMGLVDIGETRDDFPPSPSS
jgi:hypothetical protein